MLKIKNYLSVLLCLCLIASFVGCGRKQTVSGYYVDENDSFIEEVSDEDTTSDANSTTSDTEKKNDTSSGTNETTFQNTSGPKKGVSRGEVSWKIKRNVKQGGSGSLKNKNFGGKTFKMLVYHANYTDKDKDIIKGFENKYNCKVQVNPVNFEDYLTIMSTSLASGKPYDIIRLHCAFFPQSAISNLIQPLEKYISKQDCATKSSETGIDWERTVNNCTWNDHVYYVINRRFCPLQVMIYNKLMFKQYGFEDPLTMYKKNPSSWNFTKIEEYAKVVAKSGSGKFFYDSTIADCGANYLNTKNNYFYRIETDGTVNWLGANSDYAKIFEEVKRLKAISPCDSIQASIDTMVNGAVMLHVTDAEKLSTFANQLKSSAAFGNSLNNVGVVPLPTYPNGSYASSGAEGYGAARGVNPEAALAYTIFSSTASAPWSGSGVPALDDNVSVFDGLYNKMSTTDGSYMFLSSDGQRIEQAIYPMFTDINNGGDIMRALNSYENTVKTILEYNLSKQ